MLATAGVKPRDHQIAVQKDRRDLRAFEQILKVAVLVVELVHLIGKLARWRFAVPR